MRRVGERQLAFETTTRDGREVWVQITCEAVLSKQPDEITALDESEAIELVKRDPHHRIMAAVERKIRGGHPADVGLPIWLNELDFR